MDALSVATLAMNYIKPLLEKGAESFGEESSKDLWSLVKSIFTKKGKTKIVNDIENNPKDENNYKIAGAHLSSILLDDKDLTKQVDEKINDLKKSGVYQKVTGDKNTTIGINHGNVTINQR